MPQRVRGREQVAAHRVVGEARLVVVGDRGGEVTQGISHREQQPSAVVGEAGHVAEVVDDPEGIAVGVVFDPRRAALGTGIGEGVKGRISPGIDELGHLAKDRIILELEEDTLEDGGS